MLALLAFAGCNGSRKYFKAAEKLEKQGLVNEAADYYLEALQRKPTSVDARLKLKEVGQKHVSNLASEFFRNYNTQQLEASLESFEKLKEFNGKTSALAVQLDYPKTYDDDYQKAVETYCAKNYNAAQVFVNQKKYSEALVAISKIRKYNASYRNSPQLEIIATCEPLYQSAVNSLENKNYSNALNILTTIRSKTENYKDLNDLLDLATSQQTKSFILFEPAPSTDKSEKEIEDYLFNNFSQAALQKFTTVKIINNTPFQNAPATTDLNNSTNVDFIQAIRKATGADYFYVFDVANKKEINPGLTRVRGKGFEQISVRKNDTLVVTEFKAFDYNNVKSQRSYAYDFKYKVINAYSNQIVASQTQGMRAQDAIEYQEFLKTFTGNINMLFPYNPQQTAPAQQSNPKGWRSLFSARNTLKTMEELRNDVYSQSINLFTNSAKDMK